MPKSPPEKQKKVVSIGPIKMCLDVVFLKLLNSL